jgi:hypothetical protein
VGMYTELVLKARVARDKTPQQVMAVLAYMFGAGEKPTDLPNHPFFSKSRWDMIGKCSSFYHHPETLNDFNEEARSDVYIFSRSDIENYEREIEAFLDWVMPYLDEEHGQCVGWSWYEEERQPTLILKT